MDDSENNNKDGKFIRWQNISIEQFGYTHSLIFIVTFAFSGYLVEIIKNNYIDCRLFLGACFIIGVLIILVGLFISYNRLLDFRLTAQIANKNTSEEEKAHLRNKTEKRGELNKFLLNLEFILLGVMIIIFSIFIFINYLL